MQQIIRARDLVNLHSRQRPGTWYMTFIYLSHLSIHLGQLYVRHHFSYSFNTLTSLHVLIGNVFAVR